MKLLSTLALLLLCITSQGQTNTFSGFSALASNTSGSYNSAYGYNALHFNTTGSNNNANGAYSLYFNTTGSYNAAIGNYALHFNTSGISNTAYGTGALQNNKTGTYNSGFGVFSLYANTAGSYNTAFGNYADVSTGNLNNATAIGYGAIVDDSNKIRMGNTAVTSIGGQVGWTTFSDGRYKANVKEDVPGLTFINSLRPVTYTVDITGLNRYFNKNSNQSTTASETASKIIYSGFVAQEVEAAAKNAGYTFSGVDKPKNADGLYGLRYAEFVVPLTKAIQELSASNDLLQRQIDDLKGQVNSLASRIPSACENEAICTIVTAGGKRLYTGPRKGYNLPVGDYLITYKISVK